MTLYQIQFELEKKLRTMCQEKGIDIFTNTDPNKKNRMFRFVDRKTGQYVESEINEDYLNTIENEAQRVTEFYYSLFAGLQQMGMQATMADGFKKAQEDRNGACGSAFSQQEPIDVECEVE